MKQKAPEATFLGKEYFTPRLLLYLPSTQSHQFLLLKESQGGSLWLFSNSQVMRIEEGNIHTFCDMPRVQTGHEHTMELDSSQIFGTG